MNTESTVEQMQHLKLFGMSKLYKAVLDQPVHQQPEAHTLLGMLTDAETQYWRLRSKFTSISVAKFTTFKDLL